MSLKDKKKLIIFPGNFLPNVGGLETHVDEFSKYLYATGKYEITIFTPRTSGGKVRESIHGGVRVIRYPALFLIPNFPIPKFWTGEFWRLFKGLYSSKFDIVMTRTRFFTNSFLGMFFAKFRLYFSDRIKLIHVEHGSEYVMLSSRFKSFFALVYDKTLGQILFWVADKSIAISNVSYKFVTEEFVRNKHVSVIKRGVDFDLYDSIGADFDLREKFSDKIIVGSLCRLYKWKGVENSIRAFMSLPDDVRKKCVYVIVGDGEDLVHLKKLAKGEKSIVFLGKVGFDRAISLLKSFDIFVHSSFPGGALSNSLLQAMYCDCAIVASPNEGADEVIFDYETGILLLDNSVSSLAAGIEKLVLDSSLRGRLSLCARDYVYSEFSWDDVVKKYESVFEEVLS